MKRTISILMIAMMILTSGSLAAFAAVDGNNTEEDQTTVVNQDQEVADSEEAASDEPAEVADTETDSEADSEADTQGDVVADEVTDTDAALQEDISAEIDTKEAMAEEVPAVITIEETANENGRVEVSWASSAEGVDSYNVYLNGELEAEGTAITDTTYMFTGLEAGTYTIKVEALAAEEVIGEASIDVTVADWIAAPSRFSVYAGYDSVHLYWTPVEGATRYVVYKTTNTANTYFVDGVAGKNSIEITDGYELVKEDLYDSTQMVYTLKNNLASSLRGRIIYYKVYAIKEDAEGNEIRSEASSVSGNTNVQYIKYTFVLKTNKKLTSHDGKKKTYTFKKGSKITATGFGGGKYTFYYTIGGKSYYFYCNQISTKSQKAIYKSRGNYSRLAAECYANDVKFKSSTKYLIWTSLYCQHTYIYQKVGGKWKVIRDFECGSGQAALPSPSGAGKELISGPGTEAKPGKKASRHNRKWWSPYSAWNSYHAKLTKQTLGYPASKGCIRTMPEDAKFIYKSIPVHTRVAVL